MSIHEMTFQDNVPAYLRHFLTLQLSGPDATVQPQSRIEFCVVMWSCLQCRPHHASFGAEGGTVGDGALRAGDEGHDGGDFFGLLGAL